MEVIGMKKAEGVGLSDRQFGIILSAGRRMVNEMFPVVTERDVCFFVALLYAWGDDERAPTRREMQKARDMYRELLRVSKLQR